MSMWKDEYKVIDGVLLFGWDALNWLGWPEWGFLEDHSESSAHFKPAADRFLLRYRQELERLRDQRDAVLRGLLERKCLPEETVASMLNCSPLDMPEARTEDSKPCGYAFCPWCCVRQVQIHLQALRALETLGGDHGLLLFNCSWFVDYPLTNSLVRTFTPRATAEMLSNNPGQKLVVYARGVPSVSVAGEWEIQVTGITSPFSTSRYRPENYMVRNWNPVIRYRFSVGDTPRLIEALAFFAFPRHIFGKPRMNAHMAKMMGQAHLSSAVQEMGVPANNFSGTQVYVASHM